MNNRAIWFVPSMMLILSYLPWLFGYYVLLHLVVTGCAGYLTYKEYLYNKAVKPFVTIMGLITILYNPIIPFYLIKFFWTSLDLLTALAFVLHAAVTQRRTNLNIKEA